MLEENKKGMGIILDRISNSANKGKLLEQVIEDILYDKKFSYIRRQKSGSQFGYDVIGYLDNECWKIECKNLNTEATVNDIAPKLVWHIEDRIIDKFIIASVNGISNDLHLLLEKKLFSFIIEIWEGDYLEKLIFESPRALKRLDIDLKVFNFSIKEYSKPLYFPKNEVTFKVNYANGLPYSIDYLILNANLVKAYTENDFRLIATIDNPTNKAILISEIIVRTHKYINSEKLRVLRQCKFKGIIEPLHLRFTPKTYAGGEIPINEHKLIEVEKEKRKYIEFKLSNKCQPGYYEILFEITYIQDDKIHKLLSPVFPLHKKNENNDILEVFIVGKFYDSPSEEILKIYTFEWRKAKYSELNTVKFLGPSINNIVQNNFTDITWKINQIKGKIDNKNINFDPTKPTTERIDFGIAIKEEVHTLNQTINKYLI